jgi:ribulose-phosphate 3-epimerase
LDDNGPIQIAPSILDADFGRLGEQLALLETAGADMIHLDIMDGHFVPNLSIGVPIVASVRKYTKLTLDAHLMIEDPLKYAEPFVKAGADLITFHAEVAKKPTKIVEHIRSLGAKVGVSINPGTEATAVYDILPEVDLVLVMTVWPGFGGQKFISECVPKVSALAERMRPDQLLQVDGGINAETARTVVSAGANTLVAGKAIIGAPDPEQALHDIRKAAEAALAART